MVSCLLACLLTVLSWRWRRYGPPKRWLTFTRSHGVILSNGALHLGSYYFTQNERKTGMAATTGRGCDREQETILQARNMVTLRKFELRILSLDVVKYSRAPYLFYSADWRRRSIRFRLNVVTPIRKSNFKPDQPQCGSQYNFSCA
jgi:hypothetical protein